MSLLRSLFGERNPTLKKPSGDVKTSGELIAEVTDGANLIEGKQTWEYAEEKKNDIEYMKKCCAVEIKMMGETGAVPAPYYFERLAILARKAKDYQQEVSICEQYIQAVESYYEGIRGRSVADVRKGPRYRAIVKRLPKAKELLAKQLAA